MTSGFIRNHNDVDTMRIGYPRSGASAQTGNLCTGKSLVSEFGTQDQSIAEQNLLGFFKLILRWETNHRIGSAADSTEWTDDRE
jgi:hypothetical protein